jgi:site-specific recombinase XerD
MDTNIYFNRLVRRDWLTASPVSNFVPSYINRLHTDGYGERTIHLYLTGLAHFSYWGKVERVNLSEPSAEVIKRFLTGHLPHCKCPPPCYPSVGNASAALQLLLKVATPPRTPPKALNPVELEIKHFADYMTNTCGLAPATCKYRSRYVRDFLICEFGDKLPKIKQLSAVCIQSYFKVLRTHMIPASLGIARTSLRCYFRYCALRGDATTALEAAMPNIAHWPYSDLPEVLTETELHSFLKAFDCSYPVGMRDYAIARCLLDLGLRGHEVTYLTLDSVNWHDGTVTISSTKSCRKQQLPLPVSAGEAITQYLRFGRPQTALRALFVRHRAPHDKPLSVEAIRNSMNRAFVRCGLGDRFCNTHVLRRVTASHLQRARATIKEIADLLRHQSLDTARTYVRIDVEHLRTMALPWPGE